MIYHIAIDNNKLSSIRINESESIGGPYNAHASAERRYTHASAGDT